MSLKVVITENRIEGAGTVEEVLAGLVAYIDMLIKNKVPESLIREIIELPFEERNKEKTVETIVDNENLKIKKLNLNNLTKEEAKKAIDKEILSKMPD